MRPHGGGAAVTATGYVSGVAGQQQQQQQQQQPTTRTDSSWPARHEAAAIVGVGAFDAGSAADLYLVSLYWSVMTISTIGYGDVAPTNRAE